MKVKIKRIDKSLPLPQYETPGAVAFDFVARENTVFPPSGIGRIPGNVVIEVPAGFMLFLKDRSSTIKKKGLLVTAGFIDQDYCGDGDEILLQFYNPGMEEVVVERGERVAQGVFLPILKPEWEEVDKMEREDRGGFGSTDEKLHISLVKNDEKEEQASKPVPVVGDGLRMGKLIVIDGTDGSGKETQSKILIKALEQRGYSAKLIDFPRYGEKSAGLVENYLNGKYGQAKDVNPFVASLFYALDRYDARGQINKWLNEGEIVVSNRYVTASMGHQGGKFESKEKRKVYFAWLNNYEYDIFGIPEPDLNIILHMPTEHAMDLMKNRPEKSFRDAVLVKDVHESSQEHMRQAEETYLLMCELFPHLEKISCVRGREMLSIEDIHKEVWKKVEPLLLF